MSELSTSATRRLYDTAQNRLKETAADELASTIADLEGKLMDAQAQDLIDEIVTLAQGFLPATERLQQVIDFVLNLADTEDDDEVETSAQPNSGESTGPTKVDTAPKTASENMEYLVGAKISSYAQSISRTSKGKKNNEN